MLLIAAACLALASAHAAGGSLVRLLDVRLRGGALALGALALQLLVVTVLPGGDHTLHAGAHLVSYAMIAAFAWANRRIPGVALLALGGSLNLVAIVANGGVMPASAWAYRTAGLATVPGEFANSAPLEHPHLLALGDVFAVPEALPLSNVFSLGDLVIVAGVLVLAHTAGASRLARTRAPELVAVRLVPAGAGTDLLHLVVRDAGAVAGLVTGAGRCAPLPGSAADGRDWRGGFPLARDGATAARLDLGWRELDLAPHLADVRR